jgi:predicted transposase/invertase (TIGR01784 family)
MYTKIMGKFEVMAKKKDDFEGGADANRKYKDSVFTLLFSDKKELAEMYGAVSGMEIDPDKIILTTLKWVLSGGVYNDLAFVLDDRLVVLIEHQSTINNNMPLRMLLYIAEIYDRLSKDKDLYSPNIFKIPRPEFIVLYNGVKDVPDKQILRLSDMFKDVEGTGDIANLELVVTVYNINKGRNPEMAKRSPTLDGYETFIYKVRENEKTMSRKEAIRRAVVDCINQNILKTFLENHKREVVGMLLREWNLDTAVAFAEERGEERGERKRAITIAQKMKAKGKSIDEIIELTGLTVDDILPL